MKLGERLRLLRETRGATIATVSRRTGLSVSFISSLEREIGEPSLETLRKLAVAFDTTVVMLLQEVDEYGMPIHPDLTADELTQVHQYVRFLRFKRIGADA